jgi:hypothetical protein
MKHAMLVSLSIVVGMLGMVFAAVVGWAIWVLAEGDDFLIEFMFNSDSAIKPVILLCVVFGPLACISFWGAKRIFPKAAA